jgi:hypothetical protein
MTVNYLAAKTRVLVATLSVIVFGLSLWAGAQDMPRTPAGTSTAQPGVERPKEPAMPPGSGHPPALSAKLVDAEKHAKEQAASVEVTVAGIQIIDPAAVNEQPKEGQGHFHYQLDSGPLIATTAPKLSFHELSAGEHKITVRLVGNDHQPLGPQETLTVSILKGKSDRAQRQ